MALFVCPHLLRQAVVSCGVGVVARSESMAYAGLLQDFIGHGACGHIFGDDLVALAVAPYLVRALALAQKRIAVLF